MQKTLHLLFSMFMVSHCLAQPQPLHSLEDKVMKGDKSALEKLAPYLDSPRIIIDHLGYRRFPMEIRDIARRIIRENCLVSENELRTDSSTRQEYPLSDNW